VRALSDWQRRMIDALAVDMKQCPEMPVAAIEARLRRICVPRKRGGWHPGREPEPIVADG
jgi:hypothetical protein